MTDQKIGKVAFEQVSISMSNLEWSAILTVGAIGLGRAKKSGCDSMTLAVINNALQHIANAAKGVDLLLEVTKRDASCERQGDAEQAETSTED